MFKVNNKNTGSKLLMSFWCFYCYLRTSFTPFSCVSIADFEQVNVSWVISNFDHIQHIILILFSFWSLNRWLHFRKGRNVTKKLWFKVFSYQYPAGIYMLKVNNRNTRTRREISSKLTVRIPERRHWRHCFYLNMELTAGYRRFPEMLLIFLVDQLKP